MEHTAGHCKNTKSKAKEEKSGSSSKVHLSTQKQGKEAYDIKRASVGTRGKGKIGHGIIEAKFPVRFQSQ